MSDLIRRADAINVTWQDPSYTDPINVLAEVRDKIRELPSAERTGRNISQTGFLCSECSFGDFDGFHGYKPKYCPNCGARMVSEDD